MSSGSTLRTPRVFRVVCMCFEIVDHIITCQKVVRKSRENISSHVEKSLKKNLKSHM